MHTELRSSSDGARARLAVAKQCCAAWNGGHDEIVAEPARYVHLARTYVRVREDVGTCGRRREMGPEPLDHVVGWASPRVG
jgi:hypothetical protein